MSTPGPQPHRPRLCLYFLAFPLVPLQCLARRPWSLRELRRAPLVFSFIYFFFIATIVEDPTVVRLTIFIARLHSHTGLSRSSLVWV
jgi:hypothetical protein